MGIGKAPPMGNPCPRPHLNLAGMGTGMKIDFEIRIGMGKHSPALPYPVAILSYHKSWIAWWGASPWNGCPWVASLTAG